jgi:hypothetical protein
MAGSYDRAIIDVRVYIAGIYLHDITVKEVILGESLTTPGLQTAVTLQSAVYDKTGPKRWGDYKGKTITLVLTYANAPEDYIGPENTFNISQTIYRIDNRELDINVGQTETLTIHACDPTLLEDTKKLMSKSWKCTMPSQIVEYALSSGCIGDNIRTDIESAGPARDYVAENIHPFQVIAQQANVALKDNNNPDFVHYMTFDNMGTHHFRSIKSLINQPVPAGNQFCNAEGGQGSLLQFKKAVAFNFPCDFDLLSDLLNGIDENGKAINTVSAWNPMNGTAFLYGGSGGTGCSGIGQGNAKEAITNRGTADAQNGCNFEVEKYLQLRQARMGLLERDKIKFRMTVPWQPSMHVGQKVYFVHRNKETSENIYGTGTYLVVAMKHNVQFGGFGTTTVDCIDTNVNY